MFVLSWQAQKSLPKPVVFAPSVLSTTQINTNFSTMFKTPSATASKTPFKLGQSGKSVVRDVKENTQSPMQSAANKSLLSTSSQFVLLCCGFVFNDVCCDSC